VGGFFATGTTSDECNNGPPAEGFFVRNGHYSRVNFPNAFDTLVQGSTMTACSLTYFTTATVLHSFEAFPLN
jgi:hypothetical protein